MWKANGRKRGQRDSVLHAITFHPTTRPRLFGSHCGGERGRERGNARDGTASMADFSIKTKAFITHVQMLKMKAL